MSETILNLLEKSDRNIWLFVFSKFKNHNVTYYGLVLPIFILHSRIV